MADFRKWIIALALVLMCAGLASAQGPGGGTPLQCGINNFNTPLLRSEGITEQIGDIVIVCTGGNPPANNGNGGTTNPVAPQTNITVSLTSQVTSRLFSSTTGASEALLLIDEPTTGTSPVTFGVPGFGLNAGFVQCTAVTTGGCASGTFALTQQGVLSATTTGPFITATNSSAATPAAPGTQAPNVYQGVVTGNQVTFFGVPVIPPGTNGSRVFRITNVRINASGIGGGSASGSLPVQASLAISNFSALPISNATPLVGFVQQSLTTSVGSPATFGQCNSQTLAQSSMVTFKELFASAFKTRVDPNVKGQNTPSGQTAGQGSTPVQDSPGAVYFSESGFTLPLAGITGTPGLADSGTRFTAVFNNIPAGLHIFVSNFSLTYANGTVTENTNTSGPMSTPALSYAQLVTGESVPDGSSGAPLAPVGSASTVTIPGFGTPSLHVVEITPTSGNTATATWESMTNQQSAIDTYTFGVFISYTASPGTNTPAAGTGTVNLRYGPSSVTTTASATANIPRFIDTSTAKTAISIGICRTVLLFPFVTHQAGFDTGIAIANTSTDPFGTTPQAGTCSLNWFGAAAPATPTTTPNVATGTAFTTLASVTVPGFQGYMIAVCNFQFAHGFAFISDVGARNLAMGYLALVIPDPNLNGGRNANDQSQSALSSGEQLSQ